MTRIIGIPELSRSLKQADTDSGRVGALAKADDVGTKSDPHALYPYESSVNVSITRPTCNPETESNDSDTEDDEQTTGLSPSLLTDAQRKRAQSAVFDDFVREKDESQLRKRSQEIEGFVEIVGDYDSKGPVNARRIIEHVRDYQSELFARAKAGNIIAVLDTGSGKTLIAALLLRDIVTKEMDRRASGKAPRTAFFLVGTSGAYTRCELN